MIEENEPYWTPEELEASVTDPITNAYLDQQEQQEEGRGTGRWIYFKSQVLDKYFDYKFCDIGNREGYGQYICWLSPAKARDSMLRYTQIQAQDQDGIHREILRVKSQDVFDIPPRERAYWSQYEIPDSQIQTTRVTD